ncbi:septum site-determining protein MinC, partial [Clostridium perfringens]
MNDDRIQIKGTKEGINATINMERFSNFDDMLGVLLDKLTAGKG